MGSLLRSGTAKQSEGQQDPGVALIQLSGGEQSQPSGPPPKSLQMLEGTSLGGCLRTDVKGPEET